MKNIFFFLLSCVFIFTSCTDNAGPRETFSTEGSTDNNYLFDNEETHMLESAGSIRVFGEVSQEAVISFEGLPMHSLIVKEVLPGTGGREFIGTYRYDGYSLKDILGNVTLDKKSGFNPITDLYVKVHSSDGTFALISWGEIFYPVHHKLQIVATRVARHVPIKTPDVKYPLPDEAKLVIGNDIITCRNITDPVSVEVLSCKGDFPEKELNELFWPDLSLEGFDDAHVILKKLPEELPPREADMIFYGRGRGIHDVNAFSGKYLCDLLSLYFRPDTETLRTGLVVASAPDGYRAVFSLSEIMNRNDRLETLIIDEDNYERAGQFSLIVTGDFFSDRAMKALWKMELRKE